MSSTLKIYPNLLAIALPIYIVTGTFIVIMGSVYKRYHDVYLYNTT